MSSPWDDAQRPICGQKAWNKIMTRAARSKIGAPKMFTMYNSYMVIPPVISPCNSDTNAEAGTSPKMDPEATEPSSAEPGDDVSELVFQEFDPLIAPQARRRRVAPVSIRRASPPVLPSVEEEMDEDASENLSAPKSLDSSSGEAETDPTNPSTNPDFAANLLSPKNIKDTENSKEVESMLKSMRDLILQQQQTLSTMGAQNHQYRLKIAAYQDHFLEMRNEGCNQREQLYRLQLERDSFETEARWFRDEIINLRQEMSSLRMKQDENMLRTFHAEEFVTTPRASNTHAKPSEAIKSTIRIGQCQVDVSEKCFVSEETSSRAPEDALPSESRDDEVVVQETRSSGETKVPEVRDEQRETLEEVKATPEPRTKALVRFFDQNQASGSDEREPAEEYHVNRSIGCVDAYKDRLKQIHMNRARRREPHDWRPTDIANAKNNTSIITI
jgi:hypothetical protein